MAPSQSVTAPTPPPSLCHTRRRLCWYTTLLLLLRARVHPRACPPPKKQVGGWRRRGVRGNGDKVRQRAELSKERVAEGGHRRQPLPRVVPEPQWILNRALI